ncbi:hypothetical protein SBV1_1900005 [Verrucomicrobia bacterium]|nr:hypothetical protein SBV1_1900005 [Verrucomicrobiota bacterium]
MGLDYQFALSMNETLCTFSMHRDTSGTVVRCPDSQQSSILSATPHRHQFEMASLMR